MNRAFDTVIIGAGPAGMSCAVRARENGLSVLVVDDQPAVGGQIWRAVERRASTELGSLLGDDYIRGLELAKAFRSCGATYEPNTQVWQIEPGWNVYMSRGQQAECVQAANVVLATGAQERPNPFPGWTLPGVMTVGSAQILLKNAREVPDEPVWIAGSGPLVLYYMIQLLRAGGTIAGWLDTAPSAGWRHALPYVWQASRAWKDLLKGFGWMRQLHRADFPIIRRVSSLRAEGGQRLQHIVYETSDGRTQRVEASLLLTHEGVVPSIHITQALDCAHEWRYDQVCLAPKVDEWGQTSKSGIFVAGDGAGIGGAKVACIRGEISGIGIAVRAGKLTTEDGQRLVRPLRRQLGTEMAIRPMLDAMYPPRAEVFTPSDDTVVCRCEEVTAGQIRNAAKVGGADPNQIKALTRAGMGPCQGRQCGYTVAHILSGTSEQPIEKIGFYRIRPPYKQLTLGELASLDNGSDAI